MKKKPSKIIRIDPLTYDGCFDTDFYGTEDYSLIRDKVLWYIKEEGFDLKPNTYFIEILNHCWQIEVKEDSS